MFAVKVSVPTESTEDGSRPLSKKEGIFIFLLVSDIGLVHAFCDINVLLLIID